MAAITATTATTETMATADTTATMDEMAKTDAMEISTRHRPAEAANRQARIPEPAASPEMEVHLRTTGVREGAASREPLPRAEDRLVA